MQRFARILTSGILVSGLLLITPGRSAAWQTKAPPPKEAGSEGRAAQRGRGADGTREFLGLGAAPDPVAAERGSKTFANACSFCHGAKATGGDTGPDLVRSSLVLHDEKGELVGPVVRNGRTSRGMPAFASFSDTDLYDISQFLHMRVELAANRGTYKLQNIVTGDAKAGEVWFQGAGGCSHCHSVAGDLAHIGSRVSPPDLQQTFLYPGSRRAGSGEDAPMKGTVVFASGEQKTITIKRLDDFSVSFYDDGGEFHSLPLGSGTKVIVEDRLAGHRALLDKYTDADMHNLTAYLAGLK